MRVRHGTLILPVLCLSCTALRLSEPPGDGAMSRQAGKAAATGEALPATERRAMPGETVLPQAPLNRLRLAATCLDEGKIEEACNHLAHFVSDHPQQTLVRSRYAELLVRQRRFGEARAQFERVLADSADDGPTPTRTLVHCHRRLMELASVRDDPRAEHLHRGIGLYLLARERERIPGSDEELPAESLLCKAAAELMQAQGQNATEAQPAWYLYRVWVQLGQHQAAQRSLRAASEAAPFAYLTPAEQRGLYAAEQRFRSESERR